MGGQIRKQDVLAAAKSPKSEGPHRAAPERSSEKAPAAAAPSPLRGQSQPMSRLRKVIAKRMVESLQVSAQLTTVGRGRRDVDLEASQRREGGVPGP